MKYISVEMLRWQLELASDEGNDQLLELHAEAGEQVILTFLNRKVYETQAELDAAIGDGSDDGTGMVINHSIILAMLMQAATFDQSREFNSALMVYKVPNTIKLLVGQYRINRGLEDTA